MEGLLALAAFFARNGAMRASDAFDSAGSRRRTASGYRSLSASTLISWCVAMYL